MSTPNINFNMSSLIDRARELGNSSMNYVKNLATTCASSTYEYSENKIYAAKQAVTPYVPNMVQCVETAGAIVIAGVALRALANLATHLPVVETLAAAVVAGYALRHPEQCAHAVALFAIGSVVVKTLAISTCSLPVMQTFALYFAATVIASQIAKKD